MEDSDKITASDDANGVASSELLPLCDIAGFACYIAWAFSMGWALDLAAMDVESQNASFSMLRCLFFAGGAIAALLICLAGCRRRCSASRFCVQAGVFALACVCTVVALTCTASAFSLAAWVVAGACSTAGFYEWSLRLWILSRKQQLFAIAGAFILFGCFLALYSFLVREIASVILASLPICSLVLLLIARRHYSGGGSVDIVFESMKMRGPKRFLLQIPFSDDRKYVVNKCLFTLLYSLVIGFFLCLALNARFFPVNEVVFGVAVVVDAVVMIYLIGAKESKVLNGLPRLFVPAVGIAVFIFGAAWPGSGILAAAAVVLVVGESYEMVNARTSYAYSEYDALRCIWELHAAEVGKTIGYVFGWAIAIVLADVFYVDYRAMALSATGFLVLCVLVDAIVFGKPRYEFSDDTERGIAGQIGVYESGFSQQGAVDSGKLWDEVCLEISEEHGLSPRQREIFLMLAKGRNVPYIKDTLVLSATTVKSHIYAIYQKLSVHSHQELIDLVEAGVATAEK